MVDRGWASAFRARAAFDMTKSRRLKTSVENACACSMQLDKEGNVRRGCKPRREQAVELLESREPELNQAIVDVSREDFLSGISI